MNQKALFETKLIDSTNYRKLKWVRYSLYFLLLLIGGTLINPRTQYQIHMSLQERLSLDIGMVIGLLLIVATITGVIYLYSIQFEEKGEIRFSDKGIQVFNQSNNILINFEEIENLKIERGATYHYDYQEDNYLHKANNWVSFMHDEKSHKYEFIIDSAQKNKEFEQLIIELRKSRVRCEYLSI